MNFSTYEQRAREIAAEPDAAFREAAIVLLLWTFGKALLTEARKPTPTPSVLSTVSPPTASADMGSPKDEPGRGHAPALWSWVFGDMT